MLQLQPQTAYFTLKPATFIRETKLKSEAGRSQTDHLAQGAVSNTKPETRSAL